MAILFDWYENPKKANAQDEELVLHPRINLNGSTTTAELRRHIQARCSLTETDVTAVLDALSHSMGEALAEGRQVHLDGIGYFRPVLTCTEPVTLKTKRKSTKVKLKGIHFRPDKTLRSEIGTIKVKPLKQRNLQKEKLTGKEIDKRLAEYFLTHDFMTRTDFQMLCNMTRTTAVRCIRQLCEAEKLENRGAKKQPIYCLKRS